MAFIKKKPLNPLNPFNTTGAPLEDHTNYHGPAKAKKKKAKKDKTDS
jgi:hypothetical protein